MGRIVPGSYPVGVPQRWILHADMDAFYASVEQRDHPELRGKPVIVGASSPRGVVAAASYEAREFGVHSAMPGFRARELCPHAAFVGSSMSHYAAVSDEVHEVFREFTEAIEPLALDEAFLDVSGTVHLYGAEDDLGSVLRLALRLKERVRERVDLPVSVGVAPNKLVAKIACGLGKPDGCKLVPERDVRQLLAPLPVRKLWGVGPVTGTRLEQLGVHTFGDLADFDSEVLTRQLGDRARSLQRLARGIDDRPVESHRAPKSYGEENTFEHDVSDRDTITAALTAHAEAVARRVRRDGYRGRTVSMKAKLARRRGLRAPRNPGEPGEPIYPMVSRSRTLDRAIDDGRTLRDVAVALWDAAGIEEPVRLLGVSLSKLEPASAQQLELFDSRERALGPALDAIRERFGNDAIGRAVDEPHKVTHTRQRKRGE